MNLQCNPQYSYKQQKDNSLLEQERSKIIYDGLNQSEYYNMMGS